MEKIRGIGIDEPETSYLLYFWSDGRCSRIYVKALSADHTDRHISHTGDLLLKHVSKFFAINIICSHRANFREQVFPEDCSEYSSLVHIGRTRSEKIFVLCFVREDGRR